MDSIFFSVIAILILGGILSLVLAYFTRPQYKKISVMTEGELRFLFSLEQSISSLYRICPQVRLANVVGLKGLFLWHHFHPLGGKCVDFVLLDKGTGETKLVIELDDASHNRRDRIRRDFFVDYVLGNAHIPILHQKYQTTYNTSVLAKAIQDTIRGIPLSS